MKIKFTKMHALGNDFIIINNIKKNLFLNKIVIQKLSNRYLGIGFDQLLLIELSLNQNIDFHYRIFNANGDEVEQCGNGARCLALYLKIKKLTSKNIICVSTKNRLIYLKILNNKVISINMGVPLFNPKDIPFLTNSIKNTYKILFQNKYINFNIISLGNPHCVIQVKDVSNTPVSLIGSFLENHKLFPKKVNVGFMQYLNKNTIKLRVFERGVGETKSCGSGACAAAAIGIKKNILSKKVYVNLIGGIITIFWKGNNKNLFMQGDANYVYDGEIIL
ncbi:diaminopimelate epimerase [Enterobacteriaceae endosymbiont of Donacia sparganii]|uniref:diaminopimelate epimerase n=1 Tax=Enterobacteriaceae endosymbiont of Donacia sparganii TaxID=2675785 RepID=UPI00144A1C4C|nr:diaminopimelate epimerase [Enterobacteriaceae endosymbiont of Donacia sparganii]QJC35681.1 diaminopimelate epimerase [Enterobacteriaceae endosymbiont of Donacia sparganii]